MYSCNPINGAFQLTMSNLVLKLLTIETTDFTKAFKDDVTN